MSKPGNKNNKTGQLRDEPRIGGKLPVRDTSEQNDIEQARIDNRREADLEDKTPAGDAGVEDNRDEQEDGPVEESNY
jgi:hypothetical protein